MLGGEVGVAIRGVVGGGRSWIKVVAVVVYKYILDFCRFWGRYETRPARFAILLNSLVPKTLANKYRTFTFVSLPQF